MKNKLLNPLRTADAWCERHLKVIVLVLGIGAMIALVLVTCVKLFR